MSLERSEQTRIPEPGDQNGSDEHADSPELEPEDCGEVPGLEDTEEPVEDGPDDESPGEAGFPGEHENREHSKHQHSNRQEPDPRHAHVCSNVILIGATASGKTTVGWVLARMIGYGFIDLDRMIETREKKPVTAIFEEKGEDAFRKMEADLVKSLSGVRSHVIATGGGAVMDDQSWELFQNLGCTIWLNTPPEEIARRLVSSPAELKKRPLLAEVMDVQPTEQRLKLLAERLKALIGNRQARYKQARLTVTDAFSTSEQSARLIKDVLVRDGLLPLTLEERPLDRWSVL